eukprot:7266730-Alexandrium_andersonii.AAC.1
MRGATPRVLRDVRPAQHRLQRLGRWHRGCQPPRAFQHLAATPQRPAEALMGATLFITHLRPGRRPHPAPRAGWRGP